MCHLLRIQPPVTAPLSSPQVLWESMAHRVHLVLQDNQETKAFKENLVPQVPQVLMNLLLIVTQL